MSKTLAKKAFAVASSSALVLASFASFATAAVHQAGTNVLTNGTVYFISPDGTRRGYTSEGAFLSYGVNSWSKVVPASAEDLALPTTTNYIPPMDGSLINDNGTIWVMSNGQRAGITSMAVFNGLGYKLSNVLVGDTSFMAMAPVLNSASQQHPVGALVNQSGTVYLITPTGKMGIPSESVFNSWGYSFAKVVPSNAADNAVPMSSGIMPAFTMGRLSPYDGVTGTTPLPSTGNVSVSAASDMPAANAVITNQAAADLAHFNFMGNGSVTAVTLKRVGISADSSLSNVYLYDGNVRITDAVPVSGGSQVTFVDNAGLFTVNGSKNISVRADLAATAGETLGVQLVSAMTGSTAVAGTPVSGNLMTVAAATLAGVTLGSVTPSTSSIDPAKDVVVWQSTATVTTRDVWMTRLALREIGSINYSDVNNFRLFVDGVQVAASSNLDAKGYVTFVPASSVKLMTGSRVIKVLADVVGGSSRTFSFSLRTKADIGLVDSQYNAGIALGTSVPLTSGTQTVNSGSITVQKTADSPSSNVTLSGTDVTLAKYTMTAYGEPVKVESLLVDFAYTDAGGVANAGATLRNGRILVNGQQYGATTTINPASTGTSFTTNFVVTPGSPVTVEVRGDIYDNDGTSALEAGDTVAVTLSTGSSNGIGQISGATSNVPTSNSAANTVTVASGSMSLAKTSNYANQSTVVPQTAYKLADYQLTGNSTEDINVSSVSVDFTNVTGGAADFTSADLSNVYLVWNGVRQSVTKSTVSATGNTWSVNQVIAKNATAQVQIFADIGSTITANEGIKATTTVSGTTANSGQSVSTSATDSQTITYSAGSIAAALDASSPVTANLDDNGTVTTAAYKISAANDTYTITEVTIAVSNASAVSSVMLKDAGSVVGTKPGATSVTFSGLNIVVPANGNKVISVDLQLSPVGVGAGTSGSAVTTTLTSFKHVTSTGTTATATPGTAGAAEYVYKSVPTITNGVLPNSILAAGTQTLAKFAISSNGTGTISWDKIVFTVTKTTAPGLASFALYDADSNTQVAGAFTASGTFTAAGGTGGTQSFVATTEQEISGAKNYELRATVSGTIVAGESVVTNIASSGLGHVAPAAYATVAGTAATFVWSDESAASHSTTTLDWNNDFLIKNIPTAAQSLSK